MPPIVRSLDVEGHAAEFGGVPGILYVPRPRRPRGSCSTCTAAGTSAPRRTCTRSSPPRCAGRRVAPSSSPTTASLPNSPTPPAQRMHPPSTRTLLHRGIPRERIFLAGDSGGGGLANTVLLEDPERIRPVRPAGLLALLARGRPPTRRGLGDGERRPRHLAVEHPHAAYLHGADVSSSPVSPLSADLSGFPRRVSPGAATRCSATPYGATSTVCAPPECPPTRREFDGMFHVFEILMPWADNSHECSLRSGASCAAS